MKKILAGILAVASVLTISGTALAAGKDYDVSAKVDYGKTDLIWPEYTAGDIFLNPYGAAVTTDGVKNSGAVASPVYKVSNNDADGGAKIIASLTVKKATNVVIVDGTAEAPAEWSKTDNIVKDIDDAEKVDHSKDPNGGDWSPLSNYDKLTAAKKESNKGKYVGGGLSSKQNKNLAVQVIGSTTAADLFDNNGKAKTSGVDSVAFAAKGTVTGDLGTVTKKEGATPDYYFAIYGDVNPNLPADTTWDLAKDELQLTIAFKAVPV